MDQHETVVIGAGHAGLLVSYYLSREGRDHVVLERGRVGERWLSERWDSMFLITPNFLVELPGLGLDADPDGFLTRQEFVEYLDAYAASFGAPVRSDKYVFSVRPVGSVFQIETTGGSFEAKHVVVATGPFQTPAVPSFAASLPDSIAQIAATRYRNPAQVKPGSVLVVGSGNSGTQIARELALAGRRTYLSVGKHRHSPRTYRGRSSFRWGQTMGTQETTVEEATADALIYTASNVYNLRAVAAETAVTLLGRVRGARSGILEFENDLEATLSATDEGDRAFKARVDRFIVEQGIDAPAETEGTSYPSLVSPPLKLDLIEQGITTVIWANGYAHDYSWLHVNCFDEAGQPIHKRGVSTQPGLYFVGLRWLHKAKSFIINGVSEDASYIVDHIAGHIGADTQHELSEKGTLS